MALPRQEKLFIDTGNQPAARRPGATIRLGCDDCDRDDRDFITPAELAECRREGWTGIRRVQAYRQAIKIYDQPILEPPGYSVLDWETHMGLCPECTAEEAALEARLAAERGGA
ncbi:MAG: hypothetical protein U0790_00300 [Isosphaeraceae bacterium]